jgi:beta-glucosidase-like glycosyl hydrolase
LLARQVTQEAVVLLKNQNNLLPLDKSKLKSIEVVGQRSNDVAWNRVALKAGETKTVQIPLRAKDLAYWDAQKKRWVVEAEKVNLMVGASSADVKLQKEIAVAQTL